MDYLNPATEQVYELLDAGTIAVMSADKFDSEITRLLGHGWTVQQIKDSVRSIILDTPHQHLAGALIKKLRTAADIGIVPKPKPSQATIRSHFFDEGVEYCMCTGHRIEHQPVNANDLLADHPWRQARRQFLIAPMLMRSTSW
jgi:hypothetical protein